MLERHVCIRNTFLSLQLLGDMSFNHPLHRTVLQRHHSRSGPTYMYGFDFDSYLNFSKRLSSNNHAKGACHSDETLYIFKASFISVPREDTREWKMIERFSDCWTHFAHSGNPNGDVSLIPEWEPVDVTQDASGHYVYKCFNFCNNPEMIYYSEPKRINFWDDLYKHFGHNLF